MTEMCAIQKPRAEAVRCLVFVVTVSGGEVEFRLEFHETPSAIQLPPSDANLIYKTDQSPGEA